MGVCYWWRRASNKSVNLALRPLPYTVGKERRAIMPENFDPIDSLVSELKRNTGFLDKLLFPRISLILGIVGILFAMVLLLK
jgi:hypothetical protein